MNCILLRYGEIGLKSNRTRFKFERQYIRAINDCLERNNIDGTLQNYGGRFILYCDNPEQVAPILTKVSGIQSLSPAHKFTWEKKDDLIKQIKQNFFEITNNKTFGVKVNRVGNQKFSSMSIAKEIGDSLYENSTGVDLTNPNIWINVEIRKQEAFVYFDSLQGIGGLPTRDKEPVLCLFSGGIDSPVAALEVIKKGLKTDFLYLDIVGEKVQNQVLKVYNYLIHNYTYGYTPTLYLVDGTKLVKKIIKEVPDCHRQIAYKICLYKIAEQISLKNNHFAIVSGESIAQKSSQTLRSMVFIEKQIEKIMLRPLLTLDKIDIVEKARNIGTFTFSEQIKEYCNLSEGPVTTAPRDSNLKEFPNINDYIKNLDIKIYNGIIEINDEPSHTLQDIKNIISIDLRNQFIQKKEPLDTDFQSNFDEIKDFKFGKEQSYLLVCEFGVRSEEIAFQLRKKGIKAAGVDIFQFKKISAITK